MDGVPRLTWQTLFSCPTSRITALWGSGKVRERQVDASRKLRLSIADVELPDGVRFEQYVMRLPRAAMAVVVNEHDEVLMIHRHRFIIDRWVWELPGGYVDEGESPAATAAREVEEETGWRPGPLEPLVSFQPMVGMADAQSEIFLARGATHLGSPKDINETDRVDWIPIDQALELIKKGEIVGSASVVGLLYLIGIGAGAGRGTRSAGPKQE
jgi:8-oxo-dGTP pyrophosphatase MutT (NUDIX family)